MTESAAGAVARELAQESDRLDKLLNAYDAARDAAEKARRQQSTAYGDAERQEVRVQALEKAAVALGVEIPPRRGLS